MQHCAWHSSEKPTNGVSSKNAGPWSLLPVKAADAVTETLRVLGNMTNGSTVLDWGSGCGHRLHRFAQEFGIEGIGVELAAPLAQWANAHRSGHARQRPHLFVCICLAVSEPVVR